ncbi:MAG: DUF222 domain-containing protein, partial [Acidimicrobiia bacterium]
MWETAEIATDQVENELLRLEILKRRIAAIQIALIGEADVRQVAIGDGCRTLVDWVSSRLDVPFDEATTLVRLSRRLGDLPAVAGALTSGDIGPARAESLARVATGASEADLMERTAGFDLGGLRRWMSRHRRVTRTEEQQTHRQSFLILQPSLDESWWKLSGGVTGVAGTIIDQAIKHRADELPKDATASRAHRAALALESLCTDSPTGAADLGAGCTHGPSITAFVDLNLASGTRCEAGTEIAAGPRIGPDALEELWCTGAVKIVGLTNHKPVVATQSTRTIPPAVRDFVLWRDGGCRAPGCNSRYRLQPHHIHPRSHSGGHHPDNLV